MKISVKNPITSADNRKYSFCYPNAWPAKTNLSTGTGTGEMQQSAEKRRPVKSVTGKNTGSKTTTGKTMLAEKRRKFLLKSLPIFCLCAILGLLF